MAGFIDVPRLNFPEVFPYTCTAGATHSRAPRNGGGDCSGLPSERASNSRLRTGRWPSLESAGGAPSCGSNVLRLFSLCALATVDALISVHPNVQAILSVARKLTCQCPAKALECLVRPPGRRPGPGVPPLIGRPSKWDPSRREIFWGIFWRVDFIAVQRA